MIQSPIGFLIDYGFRVNPSKCIRYAWTPCREHIEWMSFAASQSSPSSFSRVVMAARFDTAGLVEEWDGIASVREIVRTTGSIVTEGAEDPNNKKCVEHADLLAPALVRMTQCDLKLPDIEPLRTCVADFLEKHQQQIDDGEVDKMAWGVKSMCRFVKMKAKKGLVSFEPCTDSVFIS